MGNVDCIGCHQIGQESTRMVPAQFGPFESGAEAWMRRISSGQRSCVPRTGCSGVVRAGAGLPDGSAHETGLSSVSDMLMGERAGHERSAEHEQKCDEAAGDVQAMEARGEVEHRAVRRRRECDVL